MAQAVTNRKKSLYPNVDYVLLAEFDIDKGSTVKHQYPRPCPVSENVLADLMLPEGAHLRETDWTIFFLRESDSKSGPKKRRMTKVDKWTANRKQLIKDVNSCTVTCQVLEFSESVNDWFIMHDVAKLSFFYNDKWTVSSIKVPTIKMKLSEFDNPSNTISETPIDEDMQFTLLSDEDLFCSFYPPDGNAVGLKFLESNDLKKIQDLIHQILDPEPKPDISKLEEKEENSKQNENDNNNNNKKDKIETQLCVLNLVRTQKDDTVRRGAIVKALAVCTRLQILESFKPLLTLALDNYFRNESEEGLRNLYETLNGVSFDFTYNLKNPWNIPIRQPQNHNLNSPRNDNNNNDSNSNSNSNNNDNNNGKRSRVASISYESTNSSKNQTSDTFTVAIKFNSINMHLTVPRIVGVDEITGTSVKSFFEKFKRHMAVIYNAIFTQKRIIFLGHNEPSAIVCNMVLAACLLTSPAIEGSLLKCYPYACLTSMQFLQIPGYIAGVTNPIFEQREEWYDLLCNVSNGEIKLSESYRQSLDLEQANYGKVLAADKEFTLEMRNGISMKYGESWLRSSFQDYSDHIVRMGLGTEVFENKESEMNDYNINEWRINEWKKTESYDKMKILYEKRDLMSPFGVNTKELNKEIRTLQIRSLTEDEGIEYFVNFNKLLNSEEKIRYFVMQLKPSLGGLLPIASYLCHRNLDVQSLVVDIISKLENSKNGKKIVATLNFFCVCNYHRLKMERQLGLNIQKKEMHNEYKRKKIKESLNRDSVHNRPLPPTLSHGNSSHVSSSSYSVFNNSNSNSNSNNNIETDGSGNVINSNLKAKSNVNDLAKRFSAVQSGVHPNLSPKQKPMKLQHKNSK